MIRARILIHAANSENGNTERKSSARHSRAPGIFVLLILAILTWLADFGKRERGGGEKRERKRVSRKADYPRARIFLLFFPFPRSFFYHPFFLICTLL